MYAVYLVVGLMFITFGLPIFAVFLVIALDSEDLKCVGCSAIGGIMLLLGIWGVSIHYRYVHSPEVINDNTDKKYQELLKDADKANKELQKFYIDHPEYKLEEKEND